MNGSQPNRTLAQRATGERTVPLTPDELPKFREQAIAIIASVGDEISHAFKFTLSEVEALLPRLNLGVGMLRAIERGAFPVDEQTLAILRAERDYLAREVAEEERTQAEFATRGIDALADYADGHYARMPLVDVWETIQGWREQLERNRRELAIYAGFLDTWEDREQS